MHPKDTLWATYRQNVSAARRVRVLSGGTIVRSYEGNTCETCGSQQGRREGGNVGYFNQCKEHIHFHLLVLKIVQLNVQCEWVNQLSELVT